MANLSAERHIVAASQSPRNRRSGTGVSASESTRPWPLDNGRRWLPGRPQLLQLVGRMGARWLRCIYGSDAAYRCMAASNVINAWPASSTITALSLALWHSLITTACIHWPLRRRTDQLLLQSITLVKWTALSNANPCCIYDNQMTILYFSAYSRVHHLLTLQRTHRGTAYRIKIR